MLAGRERETGAIQPCSKKSREGRKNKLNTHWVAAGHSQGILAQQARCQALRAKAVRPPRLSRLRSVPQLPLLGMSFYRIWSNSVLFQKDEQHGPEGCISSHVVYEIHVY